MGKDIFSNDATLKLLGYDYQKLIALECCLNAKTNEYIWLECKGDVADELTTMEIKHHNEPNNITSNSVDVWKTLKNYVIEIEHVEQYNSLILYTTSLISVDSIFCGWNELTPKDKKSRLTSHAPSETIQIFYDEVTKCPETELLEIMSKFTILGEQPNIKAKWEALKNHSALTIIQDNFRDAALKHLYGYITKAAIDNSNQWKITINDFKKDIQNILSKFTNENTPFPVVEINDPALGLNRRDFIFIDKIKEIKLKDKVHANAVSDYLRASLSQIELLSMTPTLLGYLDIYDENVKRMLEDNKNKFADRLSSGVIGTEEANKTSRELYFDSFEKQFEHIIGVDNTQKYYRDGRIHHTLEETSFEWKFNEKDL